MHIMRETRYDADPEAVFAMLLDEGFLRRRAEASHALSVAVEVSYDGGLPRSVVRESLPAEVPDFVRRFVGQTIDLTETMQWSAPNPDRSRPGTIEVTVANAPVTLRGSITLSMEGTRTLQVVDAELKASIPLLGGKVEEAAGPAVISGIDLMESLGRSWLAGQR